MTSEPSGPLMVGEYAVQTRLGEGGMGIVHLARHPDGRRVALKVLRPHIVGDDEGRHRFAREIQSLSRVRSPWVAEIIDADPWGETPYVVTRYVPGLSLHHHVREEGVVEGPDLLWFAACLAEGIAAVHAAGVLHRDIKPANVLLEGRTPILIDFGLARIADDARLTQTGWLLGTPGYLAPEILYGETPTPAVDVHAWAATVAWAATGRNPFGRGPSMAVMDRTRRGECDLAGMSGPLADVVAAALDPDPLERPLLREILAWLRPLSTRPDLRQQPPPVVPARSAHHDDDLTDPIAGATDPAPDHTQVLTESGDWPPSRSAAGGSPAVAQWEQEWDGPAALPARVGFLERSRRGCLLVLAAVTTGAAVSVAPWITCITVALLVWILRSGSLATEAAMELRRLRGARWYDAPRGVLASPWHLVRGTVGSAALLAWSAGLGVAAGVVVAVLGSDLSQTLLSGGTVAAVGLWPGPFARQFRWPVMRIVQPLARRPLPCGFACALLLVSAGALGTVAGIGDTTWFPADGPPFGLG